MIRFPNVLSASQIVLSTKIKLIQTSLNFQHKMESLF